MDVSYWERRSFWHVCKKNKFTFPQTYIDFLKKYNGIEVDKKIVYHNARGTRITTIVPIVLPFEQAMPYFESLQEIKKHKEVIGRLH